MALVGVIGAGTVQTIVRSIVQARSTALLLLDGEGEQAQIFVEEGTLASAHVGALSGDDALRHCERWETGFYRLIRSTDDMAHPAGLHALVASPDANERREWEGALRDKGFRISSLPYQAAVPALVRLLAPDVILMPCPCLGDRIRCRGLRASLSEGFAPGRAPVIVTVVGEDQRCDDLGKLCLCEPFERAALYRVLAQDMGQSASGSFRAVGLELEDTPPALKKPRTLLGTGPDDSPAPNKRPRKRTEPGV